ncbi:Paqr-1p [Parelaphostrongylus tenuis]|uniref:Paqr-1p n=1 Tax=Parelaphostrongylus tenuis TaxID=148309 RepID=A0AAD5N7E6_PARTN|nr:Paqr-1p [Parelaphostrongylus tenuis]
MGCSGIVPTVHYIITDGVRSLFEDNAFHWLLLMAFLYLLGALAVCNPPLRNGFSLGSVIYGFNLINYSILVWWLPLSCIIMVSLRWRGSD